ncbi:hypothetical protein M8C21_029434 [Ambrosia artemisiifolia]|uniref:Auxin-responsive protein n=1 Tax=Ambrosia artemisiifolia TaxID=4212 RepID=A0AAD5BWR2_AMBAR|nr:hypothetical protein M8C21_029434 [Ambrosia artemisiifolia]
MSFETSEITSELTTADDHGLNLNETELTLGLPGESRGRKLGKKRGLIELKSINDEKNQSDAAKASLDEEQLAGWPPVTLYRKKNFRFVKVAVDGAPYLRKINLESYGDYQQLQCVLFEIFAYFTIGNYTSDDLEFKNCYKPSFTTETFVPLMHDSFNNSIAQRIKYVSMYEDNDGDWMIVGDVPWMMFVQTCKRIRLMRRSEDINTARRTHSECSVSSC